jgi:hypothetical protein
MAPVLSTARARTYSAATVIGAGLLKPANACAGVTMPAASKTTTAARTVPDGGKISRARAAIVTSRTARVTQASQPIDLLLRRAARNG